MEQEKRGRGDLLKQFILSQIERKGPIPFSQFMEWCLYHPEYGYYPSEGTKIGKDGDYYTASCVHPLFGEMIAKQFLQMAEILREDHFEVVEIGGGRGFLCQDILDWTKKRSLHFYKGLHYTLVETSAHLLREQKERLRPYEEEGKIGWMDLETFERGRDHTDGCILSNELVDAFPVHQVIFEDGKLKEIYVTQNKGNIVEEVGALSDPRISPYFDLMSIRLEEGQRAEVNLKALDWMKQVGRFLKKGFVLTIDYGYLADELYAPHRRRGTFLCYYRHQTSENPFEHLGEQDMTSHVNFTALIKAGEEVELRFAGLVTQYRFLIALGVLQEMESLNQEVSEFDGLKWRLSLLHLIEPERGMGEIFKVLIQHKGVGEPVLDGLRDLNSIPWPTHSPSLHLSSGQNNDDEDRREDQ